ACCILRLHPPLPPLIRRATADRTGWIHEIKRRLSADGAPRCRRRAAAHPQRLNWSTRFPAILEAESALQAPSSLIDGEAVAPLKKKPAGWGARRDCRRTDAGEGQVHRVEPT